MSSPNHGRPNGLGANRGRPECISRLRVSQSAAGAALSDCAILSGLMVWRARRRVGAGT